MADKTSSDWFGRKVRVHTETKGPRPGEITGVVGRDMNRPDAFRVHFTDIERPKFVFIINNHEIPEGLSAEFPFDDVEFIEE